MPFACNIDKRGKRFRLFGGIVIVLLAAAIGWLAAGNAHPTPLWIIFALLFFCGLFMLFEGTLGWCALRAMGFRTKL